MPNRPPLQLIGTPCLRTPDGRRHLLPPKDALLLAMLALDGPQTREQAAARLWPLNTAASARANLRQRLRKLQSLGEAPLLQLDGETLALAQASDLQHLSALLDADAQAVQGELLVALQFDDDDGTARWLATARRRVHTTRNAALQAKADALTAAGQDDAAAAWLHRLVDDNPADEPLARQWMQWHHRRADRGAATAAYARLKTALQQQHGAEPSAETTELAEWMARNSPVATTTRPDHGVVMAALQRPPQLVDRQTQWARLEQRWQEGGVAVVVSDAGTGKTRLLGDFADHVHIGLRLRALDGDAGVPGALLARWVGQRTPAANHLPDWARQALATLHPGLQPPPADDTPPPPLRLSQALNLLAEQEQALWIDDLHHADDFSLALLPAAMAGIRCCVLSLRGPELPTPLQRWLAHLPQHVLRMDLPPWNETAVQTLLQQLPLKLAQPEAWAKTLWQHSGGHPQWLLSTLREWLSGQPAQAAAWAQPRHWPVPFAVAELLTQRMAHLSPHALELLQLAALAGQHFDIDLAATVTGQPLSAMAAPWTELQAAHLMSEAAQPPGLVSATAQKTLAAPLRQSLHAALARALQARHWAPDQLATHWEAAAQHAEAAACHEAAAQAASQRSLTDTTAHHFGEAARLWRLAGHRDAAYNAAAEQAEQLLMASQPAQCRALAESLLPLAHTPQQWARAQRLRVAGLAHQRQFAAAMDLMAVALPAVQVAGNVVWLSEMVGLKATLAALLNRPDEAKQALATAQAMVLPADDWELQLNHLTRIADTCTYLPGGLPQALCTLEQCLALAERPEARGHRVTLLNNTCLVHSRLGQGPQALKRAYECLAAVEACGQPATQLGGQSLFHAALMEAAAGAYTTALDLGERGLQVLAALNMPLVMGVAESHLAWVWCCMGQSARALQLLRSPLADASPVVHLRRWCLAGDLHRLCGTTPPGLPPAGWAQCEEATALHSAEIALASALPPEQAAPALAALAERLQAKSLVSQHLQARVLRMKALTTTAPQEAAAEAQALASALQDATPLGMHWPEVLWLLHQALLAGGQTAAAAHHLAQAKTWITQAAQALAAPLQEAFLQRQQVHVAVMRARTPG